MTIKEFTEKISESGWEEASKELARYDDFTDWEDKKNKDLVESVIDDGSYVDPDDDIKKLVDCILKFHISTYETTDEFLDESFELMDKENLRMFIDWDKLLNALEYDYRVIYGDKGVYVFEM